MTDADFLIWLKDPAAIRIVLVEAVASVAGVDTTFYMSTKGAYTTSGADSPAHTTYQAIASVGVLFTEKLSLTGSGALSSGSVEIDNCNGIRDAWLNYVWSNRTVKAYIGDPRWARADFRMIFNGVTSDISGKGQDKLELRLRDKLQRLNTPINDVKLGGATQNKDAIIPTAFGECHNVTPLLINPTTLQFQVHNGPVEQIIEVRDNGVPVAITADAANGKFTLSAQSFGAVTASIQGDKPSLYNLTCSKIVQRLATSYGTVSERFSATPDVDLDSTNLAAFDTAHPQPMGLWASDRLNILNACQMLASSIGAQISMSRLGLLRLFQIAVPGAGTYTTITTKHMADNTLVPVERPDVVAAVKLGFCRNWTDQEGLSTDIPQEHKDLYAEEWLTTTKVDTTVQAAYKLNAEPVQKDTLLLTRTDADVEAQRLLDLWKVPRTVYEFEGIPELLTLELGQSITVTHSRYGMSAGVNAMVVSLAPDWINGHVKVGFLA